MPIPLTVGNTVYQYPVAGEDPGWGAEASDWATAVTAVLASFVGVGDIINTVAPILDNISMPTNVQGLTFDGALVRAANVNYAIVRGNLTQSGTIAVNFNSGASPGSKWTMTEGPIVNDVGVSFSITDSGQIQYTSSSTGVAGQITFNAKALPVI